MQPFDPCPPITQAYTQFADQWLALTLNDPPPLEEWIDEFRSHVRFNLLLDELSKSSWYACEIAKLMMHEHTYSIYGLDQETGIVTYHCREDMVPHWTKLLNLAMHLNLALINELTRP